MPQKTDLFYWTDTHAHLTSKEFEGDLETVLARAKSANVQKIINICTDHKSLQRGEMIQKAPLSLYLAAATTPHDVEKEGAIFFKEVEKAAKEKKLKAIGETGLDYFYEYSPKETQKLFLEKYLLLAKEENLPVIIHCREAFDDLFPLLDSFFQGKIILHCFTGSIADAKKALDRGFFLSFSGILTFKKSSSILDALLYAPLDRILLETDSPYPAPEGKRGYRNEPSFLPITGAFVAEKRKISKELLAITTSENAKKCFDL